MGVRRGAVGGTGRRSIAGAPQFCLNSQACDPRARGINPATASRHARRATPQTMTILYIFQEDCPQDATRVDTRVAKQTRSLALAGHRVCLLAGNPSRSARRDRNDWMEIRRLPAPAPRLLRRLVNLPLFFNPVWLWCAWRAARAVRADCIVVRDLPLALAAVWVGRWLGIPVHYDMAEVYPLWFRASRADHASVFSRLLRSPTIAAWVECRRPRAGPVGGRQPVKVHSCGKPPMFCQSGRLRLRRFGGEPRHRRPRPHRRIRNRSGRPRLTLRESLHRDHGRDLRRQR